MKHLILLLSFIVTLVAATYSYSEDDFKPIPAERWNLKSASAIGALYLSANDYELGSKPVRWQCATNSDGVEYKIKGIKEILVVIAHQPDFPQRMDFFSAINKIYMQAVNDGRTLWTKNDSIPTFIGDQDEKRFIYGGNFHSNISDSIYASLLVYVHIKLENHGKYFLAPLVAYYSGKDKKIENLKYYAPDCDAANLNGVSSAHSNLAIVPPLGRADDYPAFRIAVPDDDDSYYIEAWKKVQQALDPWSGALEGKLEISSDHAITKLLLHTITTNGRTIIPTVTFDINGKDSWTYGDLLRHYFDHHDANSDRVNPVFLSGLDFSVKIDALPAKDNKPWFVASTVNAAAGLSDDKREGSSNTNGEVPQDNENNQQPEAQATPAPPPPKKPEPLKLMILTVEFIGNAFF